MSQRQLTAFLLILGLFAFAAPAPAAPAPATEPAAAPAAESFAKVHVGVSRQLRFTDFNADDGLPKYELYAETATPKSDVLETTGIAGTWFLETIRLRLFHKGLPFTTVTSPDCKFVTVSRTEKLASSAGELFMESEVFRVNGKNWVWKNTPATQTIFLQEQATMTIKPTSAADRMDIHSDMLHVTKYESGPNAGKVVFVFSGNVRVIMEDIANSANTTLTAGTLTVRLKNTGTGTGRLAAIAITDLAKSGAKSAAPRTPEQRLGSILENIEAITNVRITTRNRNILGDHSRYDHATQIFTVTGNAQINDPAQNVAVTGTRITYYRSANKVQVSRHAEGAPASSVPPPPVHLTIPSFTADDQAPKAAKVAAAPNPAASPAAHITGDILTLDMNDKTNLITMTGDVHVQDKNFVSDSQKITVETPHNAALFVTNADPVPPKVNYIIVEGRVKAIHNANTLFCEKADIRPDNANATIEYVTLTGAPRLEAQDLKLGGHTIALDVKRLQIRVTSSPGGTPEPQRVRVFLPPLKSVAPQTARTVPGITHTIVTSDTLLMVENETRDKASFDFTGNVTLAGLDLEGCCDTLAILADIRKNTAPAGAAATAPTKKDNLARIHNMTATGGVRLATPTYVAEGGEAVIYPNAAISERTPGPDDAKLDGPEPQVFTLRPHASSPGKRPRITLRPPRAFNLGLPVTPNPATTTAAAATGAAPEPIHIDCDLMEIIGGSSRARFFLRDNIVLAGPEMRGICDIVEGIITEEPIAVTPASDHPKANVLPSYSINSVSRIVGREKVLFHVNAKGKETIAQGRQFEIFPNLKEIRLTGDPRISNSDGLEAIPGKAAIYNWGTRDWRMIGETETTGGDPINRPTIHIPIHAPVPK